MATLHHGKHPPNALSKEEQIIQALTPEGKIAMHKRAEQRRKAREEGKSLMMKTRTYREKTLVTYYIKPNAAPERIQWPDDVHDENLGCLVRKKFRICELTGEVKESYYNAADKAISRAASLDRTRIRMHELLEMNTFDWFITLTFSKEKIDRYDDDAVMKAYEKYVRELSRRFPELRYIAVPERHKKANAEGKRAFHFHLLFGGITPRQLGFRDSGKVSCSWAKDGYTSPQRFEAIRGERELKETDGLPIYNVTTFVHGWTTATKIANREACNWYVKKYIEKNLGDSTGKYQKRFYYSRNLELPEVETMVLDPDFKKKNEHDPVDVDKLFAVRNHDYVIHADITRRNEIEMEYQDYVRTRNGWEKVIKKKVHCSSLQAWIPNLIVEQLKQGMRYLPPPKPPPLFEVPIDDHPWPNKQMTFIDPNNQTKKELTKHEKRKCNQPTADRTCHPHFSKGHA